MACFNGCPFKGRFQTAATAEDVAMLAGLLGLGPVMVASDNDSTVAFVQGRTRGALERGPRQALRPLLEGAHHSL